MRSNNNVSLQINLAPGDYLYARHILKHQLKTLSKQVSEIILTVDTKPSKGRFGKDWYTYKAHLNDFIKDEIEPNFKVRVIFVDYSKAAKTAVARYFFGKNNLPEKDFRGGPFYAYFYGLYMAANDLVFHLDSDMLLGGGSQNWVNEAADLLKNNKNYFIASPLPGPPHPEDKLFGQHVKQKTAPYTYTFEGMSTRIFMLNKGSFKTQKLILHKPGIRSQVKAIAEGNSNADLPEHMITAYLKKHGLLRVDFLGSGNGLWSLHPPYRTKSFFNNLQTIIDNVEKHNLPANQNGCYDIIDEVCDWSEARENLKNNRWWKRNFLVKLFKKISG
jgi:hypothetical protein